MPQVGNMVTIERTFTDFATDVVYTYISVRPRNGNHPVAKDPRSSEATWN